MTIDQIRESDKTMLTPADVAEVLCCDAQTVRVAARLKPELLGFPVCVIGHRVKVPTKPFIEFVEGKAR